jgi:hypothetical protein
VTSIAAWVCLGWLSGWSLHAPPAPRTGDLDLTLRGSAECGDQRAFVRAISRCWLGSPALRGASPEVSVVLEFGETLGRRSATFSLVVSGNDLGERRITPLPLGCRDVVNTVATAICVALDLAPSASHVPAAPGERASRESRRSPELRLPTVAAAVRPPFSQAPRRTAPRIGLEAGVGVDSGSVPGAAPAVRFGATVRYGRYSWGLGLRAAIAAERAVDAAFVGVALVTADLTACVTFGVGRLCAVGRGGTHDVTARGLVEDVPSSAGYAAIGGSIGLVIPFGARDGIVVAFDVEGAPWRSTFVARAEQGSVTLFSPAAWGIGVMVGYEVTLGP